MIQKDCFTSAWIDILVVVTSVTPVTPCIYGGFSIASILVNS